MKAAVINGYGGPEVVELKEIDKPRVGDEEILVRVRACSVNAGDLFTVHGDPWMIRFSAGMPPKDFVLGWDVAGRVEEVGANVTMFQPGDEVFGACDSAFAEYVTDDADKFAKRPANLTIEEAAALPTAATTALQALRDHGNVQPGHQVLIHGASGGVGSFAVQVAKALGAEVTGVCSTAKVDQVRSLGADRVVDYTVEDVTESTERFDFILDNAATRSLRALRRLLKPGGVLQPNSGHGGMGYVFRAFALSGLSRRVSRPFVTVPSNADLASVRELCESGAIAPHVDQVFPFEEISSALSYLEQRRAVGKVVVTLQ